MTALARIPRRPDALKPDDRLINIEAEAAVLGGLWIDNRLIDRAMDILTPGDFAEPLHGRLFAATIRERVNGRNVSPVTLAPEFRADPDIADVGIEYLATLTQQAVVSMIALDMAAQVADFAKRRTLRAELVATIASVEDAQEHISAAAGNVEAALWAATEKGSAVREMTGADTVNLVLARQAQIKKTGLNPGALCQNIIDLNRILGGLERGHFIVCAGRPAMGKTALATSAAWGYAANGHGVGFVSLEMGDIDIGMRLASDVCFSLNRPVPHEAIRRGDLSYDQIESVERARDKLAEMPIIFVDAAAMTLSRLAAMVRRMRRRMEAAGKRLDVVFVDYLQLLTMDGKQENRTQEVSAISRGLKAIAKDNDLTMFVLSQLNRGVEARENKRPMLSDLRESGQIEQDADSVLFLYRDEYYLKQTEPDTGSAAHTKWLEAMEFAHGRIEFIAGKTRHSEATKATGYFFGQHQAVRGSDYYQNGGRA
jgi:replicative DNA helicase